MGNKAGKAGQRTGARLASSSSTASGSSGALSTQSRDWSDSFSTRSPTASTATGWLPFRRNGKVLYDFDAEDGVFQVNLREGDAVEVYEQSKGWYRGAVIATPVRNGIFPASYVEVEDAPPTTPATAAPVSDVMQRLQAIRERKRQLLARAAELGFQPNTGTSSVAEAGTAATQPSLPPLPASADTTPSLPPLPQSDSQAPLPPLPAMDTSSTAPPLPSPSAGQPPPLPPTAFKNSSLKHVMSERSSRKHEHESEPSAPTAQEMQTFELEDIGETFAILQLVNESGAPTGYVDADELRELLPTVRDHATDEEVDRFMAIADPRGRGKVSKSGYVRAMTRLGWLSYENAEAFSPPSERSESLTEAELKQSMAMDEYRKKHRALVGILTRAEMEHATPDTLDILTVMDPEQRGFVETLELLELVDDLTDGNLSDMQIERMLTEADPTNTGRIPRLQFLKMMKMAMEPPPSAPPTDDSHLPIFTRKRTMSQFPGSQ